MASQHSADDQTLRLQAGAGGDDVIHLPSGLDRVDCERQQQEEDTSWTDLLRRFCVMPHSNRSCRSSLLSLTQPQYAYTRPASASRAEDPVFESHLRRDFSGSSHTSDLKIGTPVGTLPGAWRYRVSAGTGRPGVSIL